MVPVGQAVASGLHKRVVVVTAAQSGKTEMFLDVIGQRMDQRAAPILYVGPTRQFITEQLEPRIMQLLEDSPSLAMKVAGGKRMTKSRKVIGGAPLRLAHGGSSAALKSDPAALALVDEYDELLKNVKQQGKVLELVEARGDWYPGFTTAVTSTCKRGVADVERDKGSGLDFWKQMDPADIESPIWQLFQQGTRYHWCWKCPNCGGWFVPRHKLLKWPPGASPIEARRDAWIECPCEGCGGIITESDKAAMNAGGRYVAPGQTIDSGGVVSGNPPDASFVSFWASGLASFAVSFGERAEAYLLAVESGDELAVMTVTNAAFGELWAPTSGETPEWQEVTRCKKEYSLLLFKGELRDLSLPAGVFFLTAGIDVQKNRLVYVVRGWGSRATSWLIGHGEILGDTKDWDTWESLGDLLETPIGGKRIRLAIIDTGFRPDKKEQVPVTIAYDFCRRYQRICKPAKGASQALGQPLRLSKIELQNGKQSKFGLELVRIDTDWSKGWVHERIRWPQDQPGGWYIAEDTSDDYCREIVSEARIKTPAGRPEWKARSKHNHALDCEAMAYIAGYMLNAHRLRGASPPLPVEPPPPLVGDERIVNDLAGGVIMPQKQQGTGRRFIPPPQF